MANTKFGWPAPLLTEKLKSGAWLKLYAGKPPPSPHDFAEDRVRSSRIPLLKIYGGSKLIVSVEFPIWYWDGPNLLVGLCKVRGKAVAFGVADNYELLNRRGRVVDAGAVATFKQEMRCTVLSPSCSFVPCQELTMDTMDYHGAPELLAALDLANAQPVLSAKG